MIDTKVKEDVVDHIKKLLDNEQVVNITSISEEFDISWTTVQRLIKSAGLIIPDELKGNKKEVISDNKVSSTPTTPKPKPLFIIERREDIFKNKKEPELIMKIDEPEYYDYSVADNTISASLISNRHNSTELDQTKLYIYQGPLPNHRIHDYDFLYEEAKKFIQKNVIKTGAKKLKVYTTGLVQANAALIKAAMDFKIALSFMNYDNTTNKYKEQVIIPGNVGDDNSLLWLYANTKRSYKIQLVRHNIEYYNKNTILYIVKVEESANIGRGSNIYICDNRSDMFKIYQEKIEEYIDEEFMSMKITAEEVLCGSTNAEFKFGHSYGVFQNK